MQRDAGQVWAPDSWVCNLEVLTWAWQVALPSVWGAGEGTWGPLGSSRQGGEDPERGGLGG